MQRVCDRGLEEPSLDGTPRFVGFTFPMAHSSVVLSEPRSPGWLPAVGLALFASGALYWVLSDPMPRVDETAPVPPAPVTQVAPSATAAQAIVVPPPAPAPSMTAQVAPSASAVRPAMVGGVPGAVRVAPKAAADGLKKRAPK
jgi:hypothetical protein